MTRFAVLASVALAAGSGLVSAAPAPVPHEGSGVQSANFDWNNADWQGAWSSWFSWHTKSHTRGRHTRTLPAPTAAPATSAAEVTTTDAAPAPTLTSEAPEPTATEPATTEAPAPEPTSTEEPAETSAPAETSSVAPATSTEVPATPSAEPTTTAAPATTAAPTSESKSATAAASSGNADIDAYLKGHNDIRAQHGAVALTWADDLAAAAKKWADNCVWEHSQGKVGSFGENLAAGTGLGAAAAVKMWTDEASEYDPANPQYSHFTQVVWKATTEVGCAVTSCTNLLSGFSGAVNFHVCEYRAPGNVIGQFAENVQV